MNLKISEIQIVPVKPNKGLVAFAGFVVNDSIYVSSVAVYTRPNNPESYRLVYPSKLIGSKETNLFYPISKKAGALIEKAVSEEVNKIFKKSDEYAGYGHFNGSRNGL